MSHIETVRAAAADAGGDHPADEELFDLARGALNRRDRRRVQDHVASCASCAALVSAAGVGQAAAAHAEGTLPPAAASQMHATIAAQWPEQHRRRQQLAAGTRAAMPRWRRRLNLGLAFGLVLGALGGLAVLNSDEKAPGQAGTSSSADETAQQAEGEAPEARAPSLQERGDVPGAGVATDSAAAAETAPGTATPSAPAAGTPATAPEQGKQRRCVLQLSDGSSIPAAPPGGASLEPAVPLLGSSTVSLVCFR